MFPKGGKKPSDALWDVPCTYNKAYIIQTYQPKQRTKRATITPLKNKLRPCAGMNKNESHRLIY